ncbi:cysteine desulfurase [archaeon]|nr:cysteine desulfurase [archaeon]|tara:strand:- start:7352 stop:8587 length:1236 start_codon:yes stop_codon:yes gene_type:complete
MKQEFESLNVEEIKKDFPIFNRKINSKDIIYLDNGATTQKPKQVINEIKKYYEEYNANIHRGIYKLSEESTLEYEKAHDVVGRFINAKENEIIFTKGTTESLNLLAYSLSLDLQEGDEILISKMEHHSNLVPWQQICKQKNLKLKYIEITEDGLLDLDDLKNKLNEKVKIVSIAHVSNVLGTISPIEEIEKIVHDNNSLLILDAAQSVPHMKVDVKKLNCDFLAFSGHKMLGPTGIGVLYGKKELLNRMKPFIYGGDMVREVTYSETRFNELPWKFEAGTPNIVGGIGLGKAIEYLEKIGIDNIENHEKELIKYAYNKLREIKDIEIYGPNENLRSGLISFNIKGIHGHDIATILDEENICVRASHHCAMPLHKMFNVLGSVRISFYLYNTKDDVDKLLLSLERAIKIFRK